MSYKFSKSRALSLTYYCSRQQQNKQRPREIARRTPVGDLYNVLRWMVQRSVSLQCRSANQRSVTAATTALVLGEVSSKVQMAFVVIFRSLHKRALAFSADSL